MALARWVGNVQSSGNGIAGGFSVTDVGEDAIVVEPPVDLDRGTVLAGRYQVEAYVGKGGSGVVLRAFDRITQTPVALKVLSHKLATDPHWGERFSRELRLGRQIQHPNVCRVFDIGEADGHRFLSMELATKGTLRDWVRPTAPPRSFFEKVADARALVSGLAALHTAGIIHRDVKPENLLRMEDGRVVLSDFGLATNPSQTAAVTVFVGTPSYMAPEIVMGDPASFSSDVWALGVTMHEILFGKRPEWDVVDGERRFRSPVGKDASRLEQTLADLCRACAAERVEHRPADAIEVLSMLTPGQESSPGVPARRTGKARRGRGWTGLAFGVAAMGAIAVAKGSMWSGAWATLTPNARVRTVVPTGVPEDWSKSRVLAEFSGRVHCFSASHDGRSAEVIWGTPPVAENIDATTGHRSPSALLPETFQEGCPQLSPDGEKVLFSKVDSVGAMQVMLSDQSNGSGARPVTRGASPVWLANGTEFLYDLDGVHVAAFSLPTMMFNVFSDSGSDAAGVLESIALNPAGDVTVIKRADVNGSETVSVHSWPGLAPLARFALPSGTTRVGFHPSSERLLFSVETSRSSSHLAEIDWRSGAARKLGAVPGLDLRGLIRFGSQQSVVLTRRFSGDVWVREANGVLRPATSDGENWSADLSPSGHLAVGKRTADGAMVVLGYDPNRKLLVASDGPNDRTPSFSPDGKTFLYVRLPTRAIVLCDTSPLQCREIHVDNSMPIWPRLSPDGRSIAYVTQLGVPRVHVVFADGTGDRDLGSARADCPSVWGNPDHLWIYRGTESERHWAELDLSSGGLTGKKKQASGASPSDACSRETEEWDSPFFGRARIVTTENSSLQVLDGALR